MKLYRVDTYKELYYKSLYKPIFYDPQKDGKAFLETQPKQFVAEVVPPAMIYTAAFFNPMEMINEGLAAGYMVPGVPDVPEWITFLYWRKQYYELGRRDSATYKLMVDCAVDLWKATGTPTYDSTTAAKFWQMARSTPTWIQIYNETLAGMNANVREVVGRDIARDTADWYIKQWLKGRVNAQKVNTLKNELEVTELLERTMAWIGELGGAVLAKIALLGIAAGCIICLIWNPDDWGFKTTTYFKARHLMTYDDYLWWADLIGKTPQGHIYYKCCTELDAKILDIRYNHEEIEEAFDEIKLTSWPAPIEFVGFFYWLFWPVQIKATYIGFCTRRTGPLLTVQETYRTNELPPIQYYADWRGNIHSKTPEWWTDEEGKGCMKPAADWCKEPFSWPTYDKRHVPKAE